ncbi:MAG: hypothetical protein ACK55Z_14120, partial [bacterium]
RVRRATGRSHLGRRASWCSESESDAVAGALVSFHMTLPVHLLQPAAPSVAMPRLAAAAAFACTASVTID